MDNKDNKQTTVRKKYIRPSITVQDVCIKSCLLGVSGDLISGKEPSPCEIWTENMNGVIGHDPGTFHNSFEVDNETFHKDLTGL